MNMHAPDAADTPLPDNAEKSARKSNQKAGFFIELFLVFALACLAYGVQVFVFGPMLSLLFDSQGYLWVAQSCQKALRSENLRTALSYLASGCHSELLRMSFLSHVPGLLDIVKTGPLLPGILLISYGICGRSLGTEHWNVGALAMVLITALGVTGIWLWARLLAGNTCARIAALLAITYGGFAVNAGRILLELPTATLSIFALFTAFAFVKDFDQGQNLSEPDIPLQSRKGFWRKAFLPGVITGLLMLSRPTMLPWPLLLAFCLLIYARVSHRWSLFRPSVIMSFVAGCLLFILPWVAVKQVVTAKPSIMIERYGPLNLSTGFDLRTDSWDALPSEMVSHPDRFKANMSEVLRQLAKQFADRPAAIVHLLLRKPARLLDSPWNDFQIRSFGVPVLLQRFEHQLILLAAVLGIVLLLEHGRKRPDYLLLLAGLMMGVFLSFHLVACLFITMSRYYVTAMPVAIVAASYFFAHLIKNGRRSIQAFFACVFAPLVSMLLYYLLVPGYGRLSELSSDIGLAQLSLSAAFFMTAVLAVGVLVPAFTVFRGARSKMLLCTFALISGFCCFVTVCYQFMCSEAVVRLGAVDRENMLATIDIPASTASNHWYLVIDANDASTHGDHDRDHDGILSDMRVQLNGRDFKPGWLPLIAMDNSLREEAMYLTSFAYSAGRRCSDFRQWMCAAVPAENIISPGENKIVFSLMNKDDTHPKIFADFADPMGKRIHSVSLRDFSWSKGFFADCPGEMRLNVWPDNNDRNFDIFNLCGQTSRLKPRAFLLGVKDLSTIDGWVRIVDVPAQHIGAKARMTSFELSPIPGASEFANSGALKIKVSGQLRSSSAKSRASICLLETFKQGATACAPEFAPLAPQIIPATTEWRDFKFEDVVNPVRTLGDDGKPLLQPSKLDSLKLLFVERPWWECLGYGVFKGKGELDFRNLKIEIRSQSGLDLSKGDFQCLELNTQFMVAH